MAWWCGASERLFPRSSPLAYCPVEPKLSAVWHKLPWRQPAQPWEAQCRAQASRVGGIISGAGSAAGGLAQGAGQAAAPSIEQMLPQGLKTNPIDYFTDTLLRTDAPTTPVPADQGAGDYQRQISGILGNLLATGQISDADKTWLTNQIAARTSISQADAQTRVNETVERVQAVRAEAQKKVDEAQKQVEAVKAEAQKALEDAKNKAADAAEKARIAGILTAFLLAASALVSAAAAYIGAVHGGRHRDEGRIWGGLAYRK